MEEGDQLELAQVRKDLEDLEIYLQEFNAFLPLAVCTVNPFYVIVSMNAAFERVSGFNEAEGVGKKLDDLFEEKDMVLFFLQNLRERDKFSESTELTLVTKGGRNRIVKLAASARYDSNDQFIGFFIGINDITELKHLQNELEEEVKQQSYSLGERSEELEESRESVIKVLREIEEEKNKTISLVTNLTDGLIFVNNNWRIELVNPRAQELLELWEKDLVGVRFLEEDLSERTNELIQLVSAKEILDRETLEFTEDLIIEVSTVEIVGEDGERDGLLIILHDISKERMLDNLKVEFISVAAHQMRTPLAAIKWAFELLLASEDDKLAPELKKVAESGFDSTNRILRIINNFLEADAMESTDFNYLFAPVNIKKVIEDLLVEISIEARERGIELIFKNEDEEIPFVRADQERLFNVFQNLIENALKYTIDKGSIEIEVVTEEKNLLISVADSGIGIPQSEIKNIFTRFFRAQNAKKVETDGNGLGLYTSKKIIERHGGKIWFDTVEGSGTTFYFTLPLYSS